jgi:hypothetical protein
MRKLIYLLSGVLFAIATLSSCTKKDKDDNTNNNNTTTTACNGKTLCFKMDGVEESHDAKWKVLADRYRIYWEEGSGTSYKNIELDIYTTATGSYPVDANPSAGKAAFQYYMAGKNIEGTAGTVEITSIATDKITGKFTITAYEGTNKHEITEGNFVNVPK